MQLCFRFGRNPVSGSTRLASIRATLDGLRVLPVNVMACKQMLVIWGVTYPNRLWCIWELFTLVAFMSLDRAAKCIRLVPLGVSFGPDAVAGSLRSFDVNNAHCYDPNEEAQLRVFVINNVVACYHDSRLKLLFVRRSRQFVSWICGTAVALGPPLAPPPTRMCRDLGNLCPRSIYSKL